jgi:C4-dicarboxylate-specific signal transduction histidine kinase
MDSINQHIKRINNILEHIRTFSMIQKDDLKTHFNPNECIANALRLTKAEIQNNKISVMHQLTDKAFSIKGNRFRMEQVILSLIGNSIEALNHKANEKQDFNDKQIKINSRLTAENLIIEIEDNGIGIKQEDVENIFDPFFTTKSPDKGSGLGLSVVYGIIQDMEGTIRAESEKEAYTRIIIQLPIAQNKL